MTALDMKKCVLTVTLFAGGLNLLCGLVFLFFPEAALALSDTFFHGITFSTIAKTTTLPDIIISLGTTMVFSALFSAFFVLLWNFIDNKMGGRI